MVLRRALIPSLLFRIFFQSMMKLQELIKTNDWQSVELILISLYPDQGKNIEAYKDIFQKLREMAPTESDMQIVLEQQFDEETHEESYVHVSGRQPKPDDSNETEDFAIEYVPWSEWLGMSIHPDSLIDFNQLEIISHCIYEMTFAGFDEEQIQQQMSDMGKSVEEYKNMTEEEKRANTKSFDDFLKGLDED